MTQTTSYYPYGLRRGGQTLEDAGDVNEHLYNRKELAEELDLNWSHYGARFHNVALARWAEMDPADEFHTPYTYVGGNTVNLVDPDGRRSRAARLQCPPCDFGGSLRQTFGWAEDGVNDATQKLSALRDRTGQMLGNPGESINRGTQSTLEAAPFYLDRLAVGSAAVAINAAEFNAATGGPFVPTPDDAILGPVAAGAAAVSTAATLGSTAATYLDLGLYGGTGAEWGAAHQRGILTGVGILTGQMGSMVMRETATATSRTLQPGAAAATGTAASQAAPNALEAGMNHAGENQ